MISARCFSLPFAYILCNSARIFQTQNIDYEIDFNKQLTLIGSRIEFLDGLIKITRTDLALSKNGHSNLVSGEQGLDMIGYRGDRRAATRDADRKTGH
jgi:hypothetical protein